MYKRMGANASTPPAHQSGTPRCVACGKAVGRSNKGGSGDVCEECRIAMESIAHTVCLLADEPSPSCVACGKQVRGSVEKKGKRAADIVCEDCKNAMESIADTEAEDDDHRRKRVRPNPTPVSSGVRTPIRNPYAKTRLSAAQAFETPPSSQSEPVATAPASSAAAVTPGLRTPMRNPYAKSASAAASAGAPHVTPVITQTQDDNVVSESDLVVTVRLQSPTRTVRERMQDAQRTGTAVRLLYDEDDKAIVAASSAPASAAQAPASNRMSQLTFTIDAIESATDRPPVLQPRRSGEGRGTGRIPYL